MSDLDYLERMKIVNDFMCERNLDVIAFDCKGCSYFYNGGRSRRISRCLKREIRDWTLYRIEVEHE